jgi:hypothetical protein
MPKLNQNAFRRDVVKAQEGGQLGLFG